MQTVDLISMLGYSNNAKMMMEVFSNSSNIILTDNPPFEKEDFIEVFPNFGNCNKLVIPEAVFNLFKAMADKSIKYDRYKTSWKYFMCLYIAHFITLYLEATSGSKDAQGIIASAVPKGIASSKSVDGLSISYDFVGITDDLSGTGTWKLTLYGQQLITLTKMYGHGGLWANGR